MSRKRYVVLDRDGTIIEERHYLSDPNGVSLLPGAGDGLRRLSEAGLGIIMITNQSGIGRGYLDEQRLHLIHHRLGELLADEGVRLDGVYFCPHTPDNGCRCRKPMQGLMERAAQRFGFDPRAAFVVGDKGCDIEFGRRAGATTLLVRTGYGSQVAAEIATAPDYVVNDLSQAAWLIADMCAAQSDGMGED